MTAASDPSRRSAPAVDRVGLVALLAGTGIIAWSAIFVRFADVGPLASASWRMIFALPVLLVWTRHLARRRAADDADAGRPAASAMLPWSMVAPILLAGFAFAIDVAAFHLALRSTDVANASFIANIAPILVVIGGALFYAEHPPLKIWGALALALLGSWVMAGLLPPSRLGSGDLFALCAAISYASYLLVMKGMRSRLDGPAATLWTAVISAVLLGLAALISGETFVPHSAQGWAAVFMLGVASHAGGQGLTSIGLGRVPVGLVALVLLTWAPASAFLGWAVLGETLSGLQVVGAAVILVALVIARPK